MIDDFESTTVADIINGDFPWSSLTGVCFVYDVNFYVDALFYSHTTLHVYRATS